MEENLKRNIVNKIFDMQETEICHNPYDHEQRKLFSIESGDLRQLRRCQKEKYEGRLGRVADEDLRNDKNIAIIVITLASRAAIRGGISPEFAFTMADNYICDIERQKDKKVIAKKAEEYEEEFARQVMEAKKSPETNHYVEKAKDYIYKHLHNVDIHRVWEETGINGDYLCRLFQKYEGCSVEEYIRKEKIKQAKELLQYSNYRIQEISEYLSFSNQSSFTKCFKLETGMTPKEFRKSCFKQTR